MVRKKNNEWRVCGDYRRLNHLHEFSIAPENVPKTAVIRPSVLFEFSSMTFGLLNVGQPFQRYIHQAVGDLQFLFAYINDILVASSIVFNRIKKYFLHINVGKCLFGQSELEFLGYCINRDGGLPTPEKAQAITNFTLLFASRCRKTSSSQSAYRKTDKKIIH